MECSNNNFDIIQKIKESRLRISNNFSFLSPLLFKLEFIIDNKEKTISTDGKKIYFNANYLRLCNDRETDFLILHELFHIALLHPFVNTKNIKNKILYHKACDLVVNSFICKELNIDTNLFFIRGKKIETKFKDKEAFQYDSLEIYKKMLIEDKKDEKKEHLYELEADSNSDVYFGLKDFSADHINKNKVLYKTLKSLKVKEIKINVIELKPNVYNIVPLEIEDINKFRLNADTKCIPFEYNKELIDKIRDKNIKDNKSYYDNLNAKMQNVNDLFEVPIEMKNKLLALIAKRQFLFDKNDIVGSCKEFIKGLCDYKVVDKKDKNYNGLLTYLDKLDGMDCYFFNHYLVYLLRILKIPCYIKLGMIGAVKNNKKTYLTAEDGHAWCNVYIDYVGWVTLDSTPEDILEGDGDGEEDDSFNDSSSRWEESNEEDLSEVKESLEQGSNLTMIGSGTSSLLDEINEREHNRVDWRTVLHEYVDTVINDYTFMKPDVRFQNSDFILPSFSDEEEKVENILFLIDSSGSMDKEAIEICYGEIKSAIKQFEGRLEGFLAFIDVKMYDVYKMEDIQDLSTIQVEGRGGTNFDNLAAQIDEKMENRPKCIIIITDGGVKFPEEKDFDSIPVCYVLTQKFKVNVPYGRYVFMEGDYE